MTKRKNIINGNTHHVHVCKCALVWCCREAECAHRGTVYSDDPKFPKDNPNCERCKPSGPIQSAMTTFRCPLCGYSRKGYFAVCPTPGCDQLRWAPFIAEMSGRLNPKDEASFEPRICLKCGHEERFSDNEGGTCEVRIVLEQAELGVETTVCGCFCQFGVR